MIKRILYIIVGIACIYAVIALGFKTQTNQSLIVWFGLASAILAPIGLASIGYGISFRERETLEKLSKVPEIEQLLNKAKSVEEKKQLLERERKDLAKIVEFESRKQALHARQLSLENDGIRIIKEIEAVEVELMGIEKGFQSSFAKEEIERLHKRIQARMEGDIVIPIGSQYIILERKMFDLLPYGRFMYSSLSVFFGSLEKFEYQFGRKKK